MLKRRIVKYLRLLEYTLSLSRIKRGTSNEAITKIGILVSINPNSEKFAHWHDGFTKAIDLLATHYTTTYIHFNEGTELIEALNKHDLIIAKTAFRTPMDYFLRKHSDRIRPRLSLMISASNHGPSQREQEFYEVVWYETNWFKQHKLRHSKAVHAFGIDTSIMKQEKSEKIYDYITVGAPRKYKRLHLLLAKRGERLLIGDQKNTDASTHQLIEELKADGVTIEDFKGYATLARRYNQSKKCYIPCKLHGGGERSVLEARACGVPVEIEQDNPKLAELLTSEIWSSEYYADQLKKGIELIEQ